MLNIHLKKFVALLVIVLIIGMSSISITGKTTKKEIQTTGSSIDEGVDWWPMFHHDLNRSGYTTSTGPETNNVLWAYKADRGYYSQASPAIVDNKVYFHDSKKNFYCIDSDTGGEIWKTSFPNGISDYSPAVENGKVYFGASDGNTGIYCLNATTGEIIWRYPTSGYIGVSSSPAIYEGKVFIGARNPGSMYCLDADTGEVLWISQNIGSPGDAAVYNGRVYFGAWDFYVYCLDADNGEVIWKYKTYLYYALNIHVTIYDDKLYAGMEDVLYCLNIEDGDLIWKYSTYGLICTAPCAAYKRVFFTAGAHVYCLNAISGKKIWDFFTEGGYGLFSSPAYADGKIYIGSLGHSDAKIYCLDYSSGEKIWDFRTASSVYTSPGVADGKVYVYTRDDEMFCFGGESNNNPPHTPAEILGPKSIKLNVEYTYNTSTFDPDGDQLYYKWDWDVGSTGWRGPFNSNETVEVKITVEYYPDYETIPIRVIVKDTNHARSDWVTLEVRPRNRLLINSLFIGLFEQFPLLERFLNLIM